MLAPWLEVPGAAEQLAALSDACGLDLVAHGTVSDADTIRDTAVAQPLIVATALLSLRVILDGRAPQTTIDVTAGHSVGEFAAAAVAGVFDDAGAVGLVAHRARAMAEAAAAEATGMSAVVGGDPVEVLRAIEDAGLYPANVNSAGQVVAAGSLDGLGVLSAAPPAKARVIPLQVAGAFHTPYMTPARDVFAPVAAGWPARDPRLTLLSNADGASYGDLDAHRTATGHGAGPQVLRRLTEQIVAPVRWDLCQQTLASLGVDAIVELAPGGVLTGLARRTLKGVPALPVRTPEDVAGARELIAQPSAAAAGERAAQNTGQSSTHDEPTSTTTEEHDA